jgi:hypothetical protein
VCARALYLLLAALFVYSVVTIAAFVYLPWWQALLVSWAAFFLLALGGRWVVRYTVRTAVDRLGEVAKGLIDADGRVLRAATADVHTVRPAGRPPAADRPELRWYEVEATIFPDPDHAGPAARWDVKGLRLAPTDAAPPTPFGDRGGDEFEPHGLVLVENGEPVIPVDGIVTGPRRLRFVVGVPREVSDVQFRYYFEQFGPFRLTPNPALPPHRATE